MEIALIINKKTKQGVCSQYLNKKLNLDKCIINIGEPLKIVYDSGSFFTHEAVVSVEYPDEAIIKIETTRKIWLLQN